MNEDTINISWHIVDVLHVSPHLTNAQCREVLQTVKKNHDANYGVTWETLEVTANQLFPVKNEVQHEINS